MKTLFLFEENDRIRVCRVLVGGEEGKQLRSVGVCEGVRAEIFFKDRNKIVLRLEKTKVALSEGIALKILAESANVLSSDDFKESLQFSHTSK